MEHRASSQRARLGWAGRDASGADRLKSSAEHSIKWRRPREAQSQGGLASGGTRRVSSERAAKQQARVGQAEVTITRKTEGLLEKLNSESEW